MGKIFEVFSGNMLTNLSEIIIGAFIGEFFGKYDENGSRNFRVSFLAQFSCFIFGTIFVFHFRQTFPSLFLAVFPTNISKAISL